MSKLRLTVGDFVPPEGLVFGGQSPLFPSEKSWRWFYRRNLNALVEGRAVCLHLGCILVNRERLEKVVEAIAVDVLKNRASRKKAA